MTNPNTPVDGPFRITVEPLPTGVTLDVEAFVQHVVHSVIDMLLKDDTYAERLDALYEAQARDPHAVERPGDLPFESLVADLVAAVDTRMPVYGWQVLRLANQLLSMVPTRPAVSKRRPEGGAAA
jgi:hypothetical protein